MTRKLLKKKVTQKVKLDVNCKVKKNEYPKTCSDCCTPYHTKVSFERHLRLNVCEMRKEMINKNNENRNTEIYKRYPTKRRKPSQAEGFFERIAKEKLQKSSDQDYEKEQMDLTQANNKDKSSEHTEEDNMSKDEIIRSLKQRIAQLEKEKCINCTRISEEDNTCRVNELGNQSEVLIKMETSDDVEESSETFSVNELELSPPSKPNIEMEEEEIIPKAVIIEKNALPITCQVCERTYKSKVSFMQHTVRCKKRKPISVTQSCQNCNKELRNDKVYLSHMKKCNRTQKLKVLKTRTNVTDNEDSNGYSDLFPLAYTQSQVLDVESYQCFHCSTMYYTRVSFGKHLKNDVCESMSKRIQCTYKHCNIKFTRYEHFLQHLPSYHNDVSYLYKIKYFRSSSSFEEWKTHLQNETLAHFIKSRGSKKYKATEYSYFECQYNTICAGKQGGVRKTERRRSAGVLNYKFCPARLTVIRDIASDIVCVNYIEKHSHELTPEDVKRQRLPKKIVDQIKSKLKKGMTPHEIFDFYKNDNTQKAESCESTSRLKMTNLIPLLFIQRLKWQMSRREKHLKLEVEEILPDEYYHEEVDEINEELEDKAEVMIEANKNTDGHQLVPIGMSSEKISEEMFSYEYSKENKDLNMESSVYENTEMNNIDEDDAAEEIVIVTLDNNYDLNYKTVTFTKEKLRL